MLSKQDYLALAIRLQNQGKVIRWLPNGAFKVVEKRNTTNKQATKTLGTKLGNNLASMTGVRVCHNMGGRK